MKKRISLFLLMILFTLGINTASPKPKSENIPARFGHNAIYDPANKQMIVFGGADDVILPGSHPFNRVFGDTWLFDLWGKKKWEEIKTGKTTAPTNTEGRAIYDSTNKQITVFGGLAGEVYLNDIWFFDIDKKIWTRINTKEKPPKRASCSVIYDESNKQMIVFGGTDQEGAFSDMWSFDIEKKIWKEIKTEGTPTMFGHEAIYDPVNKQMIVFLLNKGTFLETWTFDIEKKTWQKIPRGEEFPRVMANAIYDPLGKQIITFFGWADFANKKTFSETWGYNIEKKEWKEIETEKAPSPRTNHSAIYNPEKRQMIIFGGHKVVVDHNDGARLQLGLSDSWAFDIEKKEWKIVEPNGIKNNE